MAAGRIMALLPRHLTGGPEVGAGSDRPGSSPNDARPRGGRLGHARKLMKNGAH